MLERLRLKKQNYFSLLLFSIAFFFKKAFDLLILGAIIYISFKVKIEYLGAFLQFLSSSLVAIHLIRSALDHSNKITDSFQFIKDYYREIMMVILRTFLLKCMLDGTLMAISMDFFRTAALFPYLLYLTPIWLIIETPIKCFSDTFFISFPIFTYVYLNTKKFDSIFKSFGLLKAQTFKKILYLISPCLLLFLISFIYNHFLPAYLSSSFVNHSEQYPSSILTIEIVAVLKQMWIIAFEVCLFLHLNYHDL